MAGSHGFFGSRTWQAVYVELTILGIVVCVILVAARHGVSAARRGDLAPALPADLVPASGRASTRRRLETGIVIVAAIKIIISMAWFIVIGLQYHDGRRLAPVHRLAEHLVQARIRPADPPSARCSRSSSMASRWTSPRSRISTRTPRWASARSRTSPGRACSTSPRAPSAAAASPSARPGTPESRSRRSC